MVPVEPNKVFMFKFNFTIDAFQELFANVCKSDLSSFNMVLSGRLAIRGIGYSYREHILPYLVPRCEPWIEHPSHWVNRALICKTVSREAGL